MIRFKVWFKTPQIVYAESELEAREMLADDFSDFNVEPDDLVAVAAGDTADRVQDFLVQYAQPVRTDRAGTLFGGLAKSGTVEQGHCGEDRTDRHQGTQ